VEKNPVTGMLRFTNILEDVFTPPYSSSTPKRIHLELLPIWENYQKKFHLDYTLQIYKRKGLLPAGSRLNRSVFRTTQGACDYFWTGPIVVFAQYDAYQPWGRRGRTLQIT
jgi:hypothetical protein